MDIQKRKNSWKNQWIGGAFLVLALGACGKGGDEGLKTGSAVVSLNDGWSEQSYYVGTTRVTESKMSPAQQALIRNNYRRVNLLQLPVDSKFNAMVFKITDETISEYQNKAFVAPKIFSYGTQQGGKLAPVLNPDGTVTLSFNIVFLDGFSKTIQSPRGDDRMVTVPDSFLVRNPDEFAEYMKSQYGVQTGLSALPGCPKRITVLVGAHEYDATPKNLATSDHCQVNQPMTASITVSQAEGRWIMEDALDAGMVDVQGVYETRVSYPVSKLKIEFDRSRIFSDLQAELSAKMWFVDVDVKAAVTKVMQNQMAKILVQGDSTALMSELIQKVTDQFFEPFRPDPNTPAPKECSSGAAVCLRFNLTTASQSSAMDFEYAQVTNSLSGQNYLTSTKLKATPKRVTIGKERTCTINCDRLANDGIPRETGLTVVDGNQVEIEPYYLVRKTMTLAQPQTVRTHQVVCIKEGKDCAPRDAGRGGGTVCYRYCAQSEDRWMDTTRYDSGVVREEIIDQPIGLMNMLFEGLEFSFRWEDHTTHKIKQMKCPLDAFPREGDGRTLKVRVENVPGCSPFTHRPNETPMLYLINQIQSQTRFKKGEYRSYWNGKIEDATRIETYVPPLEFVGSVSIKGYSFTSTLQ